MVQPVLSEATHCAAHEGRKDALLTLLEAGCEIDVVAQHQ